MNALSGLDAGSAAPPLLPRRRVAVVIQRFGAGAVGGAEWHCAELVRCLATRHEVTVLTSCANDATTWQADLPPGPQTEEGVRIERFTHPRRNAQHRARVPLRHKLRLWTRWFWDALQRPRVPPPNGERWRDGEDFLEQQGPWCKDLIEALRQRQGHFDAVVFFTALYHPTAIGLPAWGPRSVLVPTLHDEKAMYLPLFHRVFAAPGLILFNTRAEAELARRLYGPSVGKGRIVGAPISVGEPRPDEMLAARERHRLPERYLVYVGRIEKGKGCAELLAAWDAVADQEAATALVFIGKGALAIPESARTRCTGYVSDAERDALVAGAAALVMPSRLESLSLVLLEAMALGAPVLVNGRSDVLKAHVEDSQGGKVFHGRRQLQAALIEMLSLPDAERRLLGDRGRRYVLERYPHAVVHRAWLAAVEEVTGLSNPLPT